MRWIGLDIGTKTIGVAMSDENGLVAMPLKTLPRQGTTADVAAVAHLVEETHAGGLVLGLPLDLAGHEGQAAHRVRQLGEKLASRLGCAVQYWDERFSTTAAERALLEGDVSRRRRKQVVDQVAAALILQGFLDRSAQQASEARD